MGQAHLVTGAFGYTGSYIARALLKAGHEVRTLTSKPGRNGRIRAYPLDFGDAGGLRVALRGVDVLYNTYWVRFSKAGFSQEQAVANTRALFDAAKGAGVRRIVHVSITNPSEQSPFEYFRGKARLERDLQESGIGHTILRPTVIFGREDILINNICWMLRRFPVFALFGSGDYRIQPIFVEDFADLAVAAGQRGNDQVIDAIGPETFTYREMVAMLGAAIGRKRPMRSIPPTLGLACSWIVGRFVRDVVVTREEIEALMADLLVTSSPPSGGTRLSQWAAEHADSLGLSYASELSRRR
ncbi:MAG: SDR family oxidoreductase [Planctomycetota bacterium]|jgi:NADH dehydrogenase